MEIVLATKNKNKIKEIKGILKFLKARIHSIEEYPDMPEVEEDGQTLVENALKKAKEIAVYTGKWALADDTGLEVKALDGAPGVYSARFAGPQCSYEDNNRKVLRLLKGVPKNKREAVFKCVIALADPSRKAQTVTGVIKGYIGFEMKGTHGFGYDPLFVVPKYGKTFADLGLAIKNRISHRALALKKMRKVIEQLIVEETENLKSSH